MPLSKPLIELLATITDEAERNALATSFEKNPQLQDRFAAGLRQDDYDRQMNAQKETIRQIEAAKAEADRKAAEWKTWYDRNFPVFQQQQKTLADVQAERDQLAEQIRVAAEAASSGGADDPVNKADLTNVVNQRLAEFKRTIGSPTQEQIEQIVQKAALELGSKLEQKFLQETFPVSMNTVLQTANLQNRYFREFNEEMDPNAFMQFLADRRAPTPTPELYNEFVRPQREKLQTAKFEKDKEDYAASKVKEALSRVNVPGSAMTSTGEPELGPVQLLRQQQAAKPADNGNNGAGKMPADFDLGTGRAASEAAAALRSEGKF